MLRVIFLYKAVCDLAAEFGQPAVFDDDKLLIGGGVDREAVSLCRETVAQFEREATAGAQIFSYRPSVNRASN